MLVGRWLQSVSLYLFYSILGTLYTKNFTSNQETETDFLKPNVSEFILWHRNSEKLLNQQEVRSSILTPLYILYHLVHRKNKNMIGHC